MIIDHQANKITFTEPKTFKNKKDTVKVDTKNHWFLLNKDVVLYANPVEFQVTQGGFQLTYEDSMGNEYTATPEGTGLEYLEVNDTHDHKQAVSILVGECLSLLADPDSKSTSECSCRQLQARITELEAQIHPDLLSVYDINLAELSITEFGGGVSGTTVGGGSIKIGLYPGSDDIVLTRLRELINVVSVEINDNAVSINNSTVNSSGLSINTSFSTTYNDAPIPISVTIKNNQTNKQYTITDSISVENGRIVLNGGGAVVTNDNLIIDNNEYKITLQANTQTYAHNGIDIIITNLSTDENTTIQELGFNTQRGNALYLNENTNETIEVDLQINNTTPTGTVGYIGETIMSNQTLQDNDKITITLTHKDQDQNTIQTITKEATYHKNLT